MAKPGQTVLRVIRRIDGARTEADGRYIVQYDPRLTGSGHDPRFKLVTSPIINQARGFDDVADAVRYLQQTCPNVPRRQDGQPNRPLTAFTVELTDVPWPTR